MKKNLALLSLIAIFILAFSGCAPAQNTTSTSPNTVTPMSTTFVQNSNPVAGEDIAVLETSKGTIKMKFFANIAPETVKNFEELSKKGFYDNLIFHRVIPGFMIQGGDPLGTGIGGETYKGSGTTLKAEFSSELKHINGAVSMARKGGDVNSASSQFFIVQNASGAPFLDGQYTVFGQVYEGLDVVETIAKVSRDANDMPKEKIVIKKVTIEKVK